MNGRSRGSRILGTGRGGGREDFIGQRDVAGGAEAADVGAVFVLDAEEGPHASTADLGEADEEAEEGRVLDFGGEYGVEDPVEPEEGVEDHGEVVDPGAFIAKDIAEKGMFCIGVTET